MSTSHQKPVKLTKAQREALATVARHSWNDINPRTRKRLERMGLIESVSFTDWGGTNESVLGAHLTDAGRAALRGAK